jgi:hypothetical protein
MGRCGRVGLTGVLVLLLAWPAAALARDRVVSTDRTATNLSAFGQGLVWSRTASDGRARLVLRGFGAPTDVPIAPKSGAFDPDLGRDASGNTVVVYTRCAGVSGHNCDVYEFNFATSKERKLPGASTSRCSEFAPSISQGAVAFARRGSKGCNGLYVKGRKGGALKLESRVPADTEFREGRVAYQQVTGQRTQIRVFTIARGESQPVITSLRSEGERTRVSYPTFSGSYLYWLFQDQGRKRYSVGRSRARAANPTLAFSDRNFPGKFDSIALDGRDLFYTNGRGIFQATDPLPRFRAGH